MSTLDCVARSLASVLDRQPVLFIGGSPSCLSPLLKEGRRPATLNEGMKGQRPQRACIDRTEQQVGVAVLTPTEDCFGLPAGGTTA